MNLGPLLAEPKTAKEIRRVAEDVVDRRTKSMVSDAIVLARWILANVKEPCDQLGNCTAGESPLPCSVHDPAAFARAIAAGGPKP